MHKREDNFYSLSKSRRGLSEIVANLLIILLVLVAIGVVWVVVRNVLSSGASNVELGQFTFDISIKSAYVSGTNIVVGVRRSPGGGELLGMKFVFSNERESKIIEKRVVMNEFDERTFTFNSTEISGMNAGDEVSVAPLYKLDSGAEKTGNPTDSATISGNTPEGDGGTGYIPICGNFVCETGEDVTCPQDCIGADHVCGDTVCNSTENSINCLVDCPIHSSCGDGAWNQTDIDDGNQCEPEVEPKCLPSSCTCPIGFTAKIDGSGTCDLDDPLDIGEIFSVWNRIYFDSNNLSESEVNGYFAKWVNFTGGENSCFQITFADYSTDTLIGYLRVSDTPPIGAPNIVAGNNYSIWEAANCGQ